MSFDASGLLGVEKATTERYRMERKIERKQIVLIKIAQAKLGLSDEEYRVLLTERYTGCFGSCKDLSYDEAHDLIEYFKTMGFKITSKKPKVTGPNVIQLVSRQQLAKIEHLKEDIRWHTHNGFNHWLRKFLKKDRIATSKEANAVIEALKGIKSGQQQTRRQHESS